MVKSSFSALIFFLILLFSAIPLRSAQLEIIAETEAYLHITISDDNELNGVSDSHYPDSLTTLRLPGARYFAFSDHLLMPYWQWRLALPTPHKPQLEIRNINFTTKPLGKALTEADAAQLRQIDPVQLTNTGFMRFNPAGLLKIYPLQATSTPNEVRQLRSVELIIRYQKKPQPATPLPTKKSVYKATFINHKSAEQWRYQLPKSLSKPPAYPEGQWLRMTVMEEGIHEVTPEDLKAAGITSDNISTENLFLFSNATAGRPLPAKIGASVPENLVENNRRINDHNQDGLFNNNDSLLFWGQASSGIQLDNAQELVFVRNPFSQKNYYWLCIAVSPSRPPKAMTQTPSLNTTPDLTMTQTDCLLRHEIEAENFLHAGNDWYGEKFTEPGASVSVIFRLPENETTQQFPAELTLRTIGTKNHSTHQFQLFINNSLNPVASWAAYNLSPNQRLVSYELQSGMNILKIKYKNSSNGQAYLDYAQCLYQHPLTLTEEPLHVWGPKESGSIAYEILKNKVQNPVVYNLTDPENVTVQSPRQDNSTTLSWRLAQDSLRHHFWITTPQQYKTPTELHLIEDPQWNTLRRTGVGADYIIITRENFKAAAEEIAHTHSIRVPQADRLSTIITTQDQILREFNGDIPDPHALRFFLKYAFDNWKPTPSFVLLLGDGTYDHRNLASQGGNYIMTYQVRSKFNYSADARYTYVHGDEKLMDMGIGRIPVRTSEQAFIAADKIRKYLTEPIYDDWRATATLVADDPERPNTREEEHIEDSENRVASVLPASFDIKKLYLLEYPEVQDASTYGVKKPAATAAILDQLEKGTTIINYLGHGSPTIWAQEHVLNMERDLGKINTGMKLPFWIAATCSWGYFDDIVGQCMPEALLNEPSNGAIAALAASRAAYADPNSKFVQSLLEKWFFSQGINRIRLGEVLQYTLDGDESNNEQYILFGDPALYLALPYEDIHFTPLPDDTLSALERVSLEGSTGETLPGIVGSGILKVFDSKRKVTRTYTDKYNHEHTISYVLPGQNIFKGRINIDNGRFTAGFFVPKDLNYAGRTGKITFYGWDATQFIEMGGAYDNLIFSGSTQITDSIGPRIEIGFQDIQFRSGDLIPAGSEMHIQLKDPHGINVAGQLGHDIVLEFDDNARHNYILTEYFSYDANSDTSGSIVFSLPELEPGEHNCRLTAWDNANNFNLAETYFTITTAEELELQRVVNYPNPFKSETDITFFLNHPATVTVKIFTIRGLLIKEMRSLSVLSPGFQYLHWDGRDDFNDVVSRGIYLYKVQARSLQSDQKSSYIGKMVKTG